MKQKRILITILIIVIVLATTGCKKNGENHITETFDLEQEKQMEHEPEYGGQIVLPLTVLKTLNPLVSENISYYHFSKLIFEGLFELDNDLNVTNQLAEGYTIKEDGRVINVKLKDDIFWHDGEKFTAEDVAFTINTIKYANNDIAYKKMFNNILGSFNPADIRRIMDIQIIDDYNIDIIFDRSFSHGLETLTFPIIPRHKFVEGIENKTSYINALSEEDYIPVGTGPYEFVNYEKYKTIKLKSYEDYREGKPYIDQIMGKVLEDGELVLTAFETGQVHVTTTQGIDWEKYDQNNRIRIYEFVSQNYEFLGFNFSKGFFNNENGKGLRKAMAYGIDRQAIIERLYFGHATQTDLPIHPNSWLLSDEANVYGYNPSKARQEIEKLGWKDINGDGFYEDENGKEIVLRLITNSYNSLRLKTADMIVEDLKKIGINVIKDYPEIIPDNLPEEAIESQWENINNKILKGDYDIALLGWHLSAIPELSFAFHSSQIKTNTNFIRYNNEIMDEVLVEAFNASSRDNKLKTYKKLQEIITEELPYISLYFKNNALLVDKKIMGDIDPTLYNLYRNIEKWYIPKELQQKIVEKN